MEWNTPYRVYGYGGITKRKVKNKSGLKVWDCEKKVRGRKGK